MTQPSPEPKIYAPFLVALETQHPTIAPFLIGVGDRPWQTDGKKTLVTALFQTACETPFEGSYLTEFSTADGDARTFLGKMIQKFHAVSAEDKRLGKKQKLDLAPAPVVLVVGGDEHDDPEPPVDDDEAPVPPVDNDSDDDQAWDDETKSSA
jgi:hypothetical protein